MDWLKGMNQALDYVESNLDGTISSAEIAKFTNCSQYHFLRLFSTITGLPLSEYIRRRRLSKAAFDLQNTDEKVIDIGLKYGYSSPTAFNRAFANQHGVSPSKAREKGVVLKDYPKISFQITMKGEVEMEYKIVELDAFKIVGAKLETTFENEKSYEEVPKFWQKCAMEGTIMKMLPLMNTELKGVLGVSSANYVSITSEPRFDYYIAVASNAPTPEGFDQFIVPAATWAIFDCYGPLPHTLTNLQKRIVTEWLPTSGYEYADAPDIEWNSEGDPSAADYHTQAWLPVRKKQG